MRNRITVSASSQILALHHHITWSRDHFCLCRRPVAHLVFSSLCPQVGVCGCCCTCFSPVSGRWVVTCTISITAVLTSLCSEDYCSCGQTTSCGPDVRSWGSHLPSSLEHCSCLGQHRDCFSLCSQELPSGLIKPPHSCLLCALGF